MKGNRFIAAIFCMPVVAVLLIGCASATLQVQVKAGSKSNIHKEMERQKAIAQQVLSPAERELLEFLEQTRTGGGADDPVDLSIAASAYTADGTLYTAARKSGMGTAALSKVESVGGELVTTAIALEEGVAVDGQTVDAGPLFDAKLSNLFVTKSDRVIVVVAGDEGEAVTVYEVLDNGKQLKTIPLVDNAGNAVKHVFAVKELTDGSLLVIAPATKAAEVKEESDDQVATSGGNVQDDDAKEEVVATSGQLVAQERISRPRVVNPGTKFRTVSLTISPDEPTTSGAVATSGGVSTSGSGAGSSGTVEEKEDDGDPAQVQQLPHGLMATVIGTDGKQGVVVLLPTGVGSDSASKSLRGKTPLGVVSGDKAKTRLTESTLGVENGDVQVAQVADDTFVLGLHVTPQAPVESSTRAASGEIIEGGTDGTVSSLVTLRVVAGEPVFQSLVAAPKEKNLNALPFTTSAQNSTRSGDNTVRVHHLDAMKAHNGDTLLVSNVGRGKLPQEPATSGGETRTSGVATNAPAPQVLAFQINDGRLGFKKPDGSVVTAERFAQMPAEDNTNRSMHVGGLPAEIQEQFGGAQVQDMKVVGDTVYIALAGNRAEQRGVFASSAIYGDGGFIIAWSRWQRVSAPVAAFLMNVNDDGVIAFVSTASGLPDASAPNTIHVAGFGTTDEVLGNNLSSELAKVFTIVGNIAGVYRFPAGRSGIAAGHAFMAVTAPGTVAFLEEGAEKYRLGDNVLVFTSNEQAAALDGVVLSAELGDVCASTLDFGSLGTFTIATAPIVGINAPSEKNNNGYLYVGGPAGLARLQASKSVRTGVGTKDTQGVGWDYKKGLSSVKEILALADADHTLEFKRVGEASGVRYILSNQEHFVVVNFTGSVSRVDVYQDTDFDVVLKQFEVEAAFEGLGDTTLLASKSVTVQGFVTDVKLMGDRLLVASSGDGLTVVDLTDMSSFVVPDFSSVSSFSVTPQAPGSSTAAVGITYDDGLYAQALVNATAKELADVVTVIPDVTERSTAGNAGSIFVGGGPELRVSE